MGVVGGLGTGTLKFACTKVALRTAVVGADGVVSKGSGIGLDVRRRRPLMRELTGEALDGPYRRYCSKDLE